MVRHWFWAPGIAGSIPVFPTNEGIAQSGLEHLAFNQRVAGSNPAAFILTIKNII